MAKFRKKPVVIEAEQWCPGKDIEGVCTDTDDYVPGAFRCHTGQPHIHTLEGDLYVSAGDWIVTDAHGDQSCCKADIFEQSYEAVEP